MPALAWWILGGLVQIAGTLAGRVLLALGFGFVSYTGVSVTLGWLKAQMLAGFAGLTPQMLGIMATLKIGEGISILFSALLVRLTLNGLSAGGSITKLVKS